MDIRVQQAREHHQAAASLEAEAGRRRAIRDRLIRELYAEDPQKWSYRNLAAAIGCSFKLIGIIVTQNQAGTSA